MTKRILDTTSLSINNILTRGDIRWKQVAHFEAGLLTPNPVGFDSVGGIDTSTLLVTNAAAIRGNFGCAVGIPNVNTRYGILSEPNNENAITFEFYLDPNSIVMAPADNFNFVRVNGSGPTGATFFVRITNFAPPAYHLDLYYTTDGGALTFVDRTPIANEAVLVRIKYKASSAPAANDGSIRLYVNGILGVNGAGLDTDQHDVDSFWIGGVGGIDAGTTGTIFIDNIRWIDKFL